MNGELMNDDVSGMDLSALQTLYAKTLYVLREARKALLKQYGVADEAQLLERIRCNEASEHPSYEHYLSARIMEQTRMQVRADLLARVGGMPDEGADTISVHLVLKECIEANYGERLCEPPRMAQDALLLSFDTGLMMEVRYFSKEEYAVYWSWGEAEFRLDTAPVHGECASFPHHLHRDDGTIVEDTITTPGDDAWRNFSALLDVLLTDPLLESAGAARS